MKILIITSILIFFVACMQEAVLENLPPPSSPDVRLKDAPEGKTLNILSTSEAYTNSPTINIFVKKCPEKSFILFTEKLDKPKKDSKLWESCNGDQTFAYDFNDPITNETKSIYVWAMNKNKAISKDASKLQMVYDTVPPEIKNITINNLVNNEFIHNDKSTTIFSIPIYWDIVEANIIKGLEMSLEFSYKSDSSLFTPTFIDKIIITDNKILNYDSNLIISDHVYYKNTTIKITMVDAAGNVVSKDSTSFLIDTSILPDEPAVVFDSLYSGCNGTLNILSGSQEAYTNTTTNSVIDDVRKINIKIQNSDKFSTDTSFKVTESPDKPDVNDDSWVKGFIVPYKFTDGEGLKHLYVWAYDNLDSRHISPVSNELKLTYDHTPPTVKFSQEINFDTLPELKDSSKNDATIKFEITETNIIMGLPIKIEWSDGNTWTLIPNLTISDSTKRKFEAIWNVPDLDILNAKLRISFTDAAGNPSEIIESNPFSISKQFPEIDTFVLANNLESIAMPFANYKLTLKSRHKDVVSIYLSESNTLPKDTPVAWQNFNNGEGTVNLSASPLGKKTVYAWVMDESKKISEPVSDEIKLDFAYPPKIEIISPISSKVDLNGNPINLNNILVQWECTEGDIEQHANPLKGKNPVIVKYVFNDSREPQDILEGENLPAIGKMYFDGSSAAATGKAFRFLVYCTSEAGVVSNKYSQFVNTSDWELFMGDNTYNIFGINSMLIDTVADDSNVQHGLSNDKDGNVYYVKNHKIMRIDHLTSKVTIFYNNNTYYPVIIGTDSSRENMFLYPYKNQMTIYKIPFSNPQNAIQWNNQVYINNDGAKGQRRSWKLGSNGYLIFFAGVYYGALLYKVNLNVQNDPPVLIHGKENLCQENDKVYTIGTDATEVPIRGVTVRDASGNVTGNFCYEITESTLIANEDLSEILIKMGAWGWYGAGTEPTWFYKIKYDSQSGKYKINTDQLSSLFGNDYYYGAACTITADLKTLCFRAAGNKLSMAYIHFDIPIGSNEIIDSDIKWNQIYTNESPIAQILNATTAEGNAYYIESLPGIIYRVFKDNSGKWNYIRIAGREVDVAGNGDTNGFTGDSILLRNPADIAYRETILQNGTTQKFLYVQSKDGDARKIVFKNNSTYSISTITRATSFGCGDYGSGSAYVWFDTPITMSNDGKKFTFRCDWKGARIASFNLNHEDNTIFNSNSLIQDGGYSDVSPYPRMDLFTSSYIDIYPPIFKNEIFGPERFAFANDKFYFSTIGNDGNTMLILEESMTPPNYQRIKLIAGKEGTPQYLQPDSGNAIDASLKRVQHLQSIVNSNGTEDLVFWDGQYLRKINLNTTPYKIELIADLGIINSSFKNGEALDLNSSTYTQLMDAIYDPVAQMTYLVVGNSNGNDPKVIKIDIGNNSYSIYTLTNANVGDIVRLALTPNNLLLLQKNEKRILKLSR